ncbi:MAG: ribonuclease Z [Promethearchaeota archaeon]|nr:MAG: ribonuclease Z [Candidatus Lokiarchaeota archaeon]
MEVHFLGTSGSIPTKERNLISIAIKRRGKIYLFDPGENTQRQMIKNKLSIFKISSIFITHLHGDHIMGIPGLIMSSSLLNREEDLFIYGPPGTARFITGVIESVIVDLGFRVLIKEFNEPCTVLEDDELKISCGLAEHRCFGLYYVFSEKDRPGKFHRKNAEQLGIPMGPLWKQLQEGEDIILENGEKVFSHQVVGPPRPGRKIVIALDTRPIDDIKKSAENADLLIFDSTYDSSLKDKALENKHSTAREAAILAKDAKVKSLALTHFSSRYSDLSSMKDEVSNIYPEAIFPDDLTVITIPFEEEN